MIPTTAHDQRRLERAADRAARRKNVVRDRGRSNLGPPGLTLHDGHDDGPDDAGRARRLDWAKLMKRAYAVDVLRCPRCEGPTRLVSLIEDQRIAQKILFHLGLSTRAPPRGPPWRPGQQRLPVAQRA